jgi:hypothetical protein
MTYLVQFWLILEREIVDVPHKEYLLYISEHGTKNTIECNLTNTFGLIEFGSVMKKL